MDPRAKASAMALNDEALSSYARDPVAFVEEHATPAERAALEELATRDRGEAKAEHRARMAAALDGFVDDHGELLAALAK